MNRPNLQKIPMPESLLNEIIPFLLTSLKYLVSISPSYIKLSWLLAKLVIYENIEENNKGNDLWMLLKTSSKMKVAYELWILNLLMHNIPKWQTHFKNLAANAAGFLKCVWLFWNAFLFIKRLTQFRSKSKENIL